MPTPEFDTKKFPKENVGGLRSQKPPNIKGAGPGTFQPIKFGGGTENQSPQRAHHPPNLKGDGVQQMTGSFRFGQQSGNKHRSMNPKAPRSGSKG